MSHPAWRALLGVTVAATAGCFTHPINRAPIVMKPESTTGSVLVKGEDATFTVDASDPDQDSLSLTWAVTKDKDCPNPKEPANWPPAVTSPSPSTFTVSKQDTEGSFCVWAFATDRYGAIGANNRTFAPTNPANSPPLAMITLTKPTSAKTYPLYTKFHLLGSGSDPDGDMITKLMWLPLQAPSPNATLGPCDDDSDGDDVRCFMADTPGDYTASLKVSSRSPFQTVDESPQAGMMTFTVLQDAPPCIAMTEPAWNTVFVPLDTNDKHTFVVKTVDDDGDPLPARDPNQTSNLSFTWYFGTPGAPLNVLDGDSPMAVISGRPTFNVGDTGLIRVEVRDRRSSALAKLASCGDDPVCAADMGSGCYQRVTWTVKWL